MGDAEVLRTLGDASLISTVFPTAEDPHFSFDIFLYCERSCSQRQSSFSRILNLII